MMVSLAEQLDSEGLPDASGLLRAFAGLLSQAPAAEVAEVAALIKDPDYQQAWLRIQTTCTEPAAAPSTEAAAEAEGFECDHCNTFSGIYIEVAAHELQCRAEPVVQAKPVTAADQAVVLLEASLGHNNDDEDSAAAPSNPASCISADSTSVSPTTQPDMAASSEKEHPLQEPTTRALEEKVKALELALEAEKASRQALEREKAQLISQLARQRLVRPDSPVSRVAVAREQPSLAMLDQEEVGGYTLWETSQWVACCKAQRQERSDKARGKQSIHSAIASGMHGEFQRKTAELSDASANPSANAAHMQRRLLHFNKHLGGVEREAEAETCAAAMCWEENEYVSQEQM